MELQLLTPEGLPYKPLPAQAAFHASNAIYRAYVGGFGSHHCSSLVRGVPIAELTRPSIVSTLEGDRPATHSFIEGRADMYEVRTRSGRVDRVTLDHRYLSPAGWCRLRDLAVGSLIAAGDTEDGRCLTGTPRGSSSGCSSGSRPYGELPPPAAVALRDRLQRQPWLQHCPPYQTAPSHPSTGSFAHLQRPSSALENQPGPSCGAELLPGHRTSLPPLPGSGPLGSTGRLHQDRCVRSSGDPYSPPSLLEYPSDAGLTTLFPDIFPVSLRPSFAFRVPGKAEEPRHSHALSFQGVSCSYLYNIESPAGCQGWWDEITDIQWHSFGDFYDLHVPGAEHYLAHGLYHHNSGKTLCGAVESFMASQEYPGGVGFVARYDWDELGNTSWKTLTDIIPQEFIHTITQRPPRIQLRNGSVILGYNLRRREKQRSLNLSWAWIDECNEDGVTEDHFKELIGRCRSRKGVGKIWLTGNPAGRNWVYQRFFAHQFEPSAKKWPRHEGFRATSSENTYNPDWYNTFMEENFDAEWLSKFKAGDFSVFEGMILESFDRDIHVIPPFRVPLEWPRCRSIDHGLTNPTACLWGTTDFQGRVYIYKEYYKRQSVIHENVDAINELSGDEEYLWTVIDPSTRQRQQAGGTSERLIEQYRKAGLSLIEGDNDFAAAVTRIRSLLAFRDSLSYPAVHPLAGQSPSPGLFITSDCPSLIWELGQWRWKDAKPGSNAAAREYNMHNHACAALRYMCLQLPSSPEPIPEPHGRSRFDILMEELGRPDDLIPDSYYIR